MSGYQPRGLTLPSTPIARPAAVVHRLCSHAGLRHGPSPVGSSALVNAGHHLSTRHLRDWLVRAGPRVWCSRPGHGLGLLGVGSAVVAPRFGVGVRGHVGWSRLNPLGRVPRWTASCLGHRCPGSRCRGPRTWMTFFTLKSPLFWQGIETAGVPFPWSPTVFLHRRAHQPSNTQSFFP